MNTISTIDAAEIPAEWTSFLARHPKVTRFLERIWVVKSSTVNARVTSQVDTVLTQNPRLLMQQEATDILVNARRTFKDTGAIMSPAVQNKFFTLCYKLFIKEEAILIGNPQGNIKPLKSYLAHVGTNINEIESLCWITKA